ncbi:cilia- and flagella-associated protein 61 [Biomphalaria glabrata]|nr:cilia- and flagella-associated protein 61-like [Biomphalaria glabrata]
MATFNVEADAEVITARRTESIDAPHILKLVKPWTEKLFGRVNIVNIIEKAVLAITLCNKEDEILGHGAFLDYPNLPDVDQAEWEAWYSSRYTSEQVTPLNSLFLHYFVSKSSYAAGCAQEIIKTAFNAVPDLHFLFLLIPKGYKPDSSLTKAFSAMEKKELAPSDSHSLFVCKRHEHVRTLHIRQAFVEDHDDLTPIFNRQSEMLHNTYGDYFLAELIEAQDAEMQCLVAEVEKTSYGFMSISTDVNLDLLNECFELIPFNGLRKPHPDDNIVEPPRPTSSENLFYDSNARNDALSVSSNCSDKTETTFVKKTVKLSQSALTVPVSNVAFVQRVPSPTSVAEMLLSEKGNENTELKAPKYLKPEKQRRFVPTFCGAPNAFSIQLFCIAEQYEMRSFDFLPKAFSKFPDRDFCIITVPHMVPEFPLIQNFVRVTPKGPSILPQELYVFHRSGLLKNFKVRKAVKADFENIEKLVDTITHKTNILRDLQVYLTARRDPDGTEIQAFVGECLGQIVGVSIIRREEDIDYIRAHYNIEDFIYFNHHSREQHGHLNHFVVNPVFSHLTKHFFKEILRLSRKTSLYYALYPPFTSEANVDNFSLITGLNALVPVRPRRQIDYSDGLGINGPSEHIIKVVDHYALNHINRKLVLEPKVTINARIVVVGASDVGMTFMETLVFCPHLKFNNITLISPHGLPGDLPPHEIRDTLLANSFAYGKDDYAKLALRTWVNVVYGKMTALDRTKKQVVVNDADVVPYDHLVICTGQQYLPPSPTGAELTHKPVQKETFPCSPDARYRGQVPGNLYTINDAYDAALLLHKVHFSPKNIKIVVYGNTVDAYTCLQALLSSGVKGDCLALVEPPVNDSVTCFNNPDVENEIKRSLQALDVTLHTDCYLACWNEPDSEKGDDIKSVSFTHPNGFIKLSCDIFICFYKRDVDLEAFTAMNCACLVYDGKLVINATFHTNDVSIRAAGPLTKFSRKYHCEPWTHCNFNSREVGIALNKNRIEETRFCRTIPHSYRDAHVAPFPIHTEMRMSHHSPFIQRRMSHHSPFIQRCACRTIPHSYRDAQVAPLPIHTEMRKSHHSPFIQRCACRTIPHSYRDACRTIPHSYRDAHVAPFPIHTEMRKSHHSPFIQRCACRTIPHSYRDAHVAPFPIHTETHVAPFTIHTEMRMSHHSPFIQRCACRTIPHSYRDAHVAPFPIHTEMRMSHHSPFIQRCA